MVYGISAAISASLVVSYLYVAGVVSNNGKLFVIGGDDGSSNLSSVEFYNPKTDTWTILSSSMTTGRSYAGVCVIDKPL